MRAAVGSAGFGQQLAAGSRVSDSSHRPAPPAPQVQRCTLLSIKTGGCPENCGYCSQSSSWAKETGTKAEKLMGLEEVYEVRTVGVGVWW